MTNDKPTGGPADGTGGRERNWEKRMIDANKLQCFTTAAWLRGYAAHLNEYEHGALIHKMNQAADLLEAVWEEYINETQRSS